MGMGWWPQVTLGDTRVAREFPATHIRHGADGGLRTSQDRTHESGHGTWNMDRHVGELEALGQSWGWGAQEVWGRGTSQIMGQA